MKPTASASNRPRLWAGAACLAALLCSAGAQAAWTLQAVTLTSDASGSRSEVRLLPDGSRQSDGDSGSAGSVPRWEAFALSAPDRYVIDIYGVTLETGTPPPQIPADSIVQAVRVGQHPQDRVRIVFDLKRRPLMDRTAVVYSAPPGNPPQIEVQFARQALATSGASAALAASTRETAQTPAPAGAGAAQGTARADSAAPSNSTAKRADRASRAAAGGTGALVFGGDRAPREPRATAAVNNDSQRWSASLNRGLLETGYVDPDAGGGANLHLQTIASVEGELSPGVRLRASARIDGQYQYGDLPSLERTRVDYDETWIRVDRQQWRLTAGAQRIIWGRTDEFSPTDLLSTRDFTRLLLDDLQDRRRANPALRLEWLDDNQRLDLVYLPVFREAELPGRDSIWYPIDFTTGAVAGLPLTDPPRSLLIGATVSNDIDGDAGFGLRYTRTGSRLDFSLTGQRVHNPDPYFTLVRAPTASTPAELAAVYPRTTVIGGDVAAAVGAWTLRAEAAWLSDAPYTRAGDFSLQTSEAFNWAVGAEVFPGDGDLRVTTQVSGRHLLDTQEAVDFTDIYSLYGEVETPFVAAGLPWRAQLRYSWRLDEDGLYLNPELSYTGWEPSEIYIGVHIFDGDYGTAEGFYSDKDIAVIGWRASF